MGKMNRLSVTQPALRSRSREIGDSIERRRLEVAMQTEKSERAARTVSASAPDGGALPLQVVCFSTYVSDPVRQEPRHRDGRNFLLALRGERIEAESKIPVGGEERPLSATNANDSIDWFGEMVARYLTENDFPRRVALVPVPTSRTTLESSAAPAGPAILDRGRALREHRRDPKARPRRSGGSRRLPLYFERHAARVRRPSAGAGSAGSARGLRRPHDGSASPRSLHRGGGKNLGLRARALAVLASPGFRRALQME